MLGVVERLAAVGAHLQRRLAEHGADEARGVLLDKVEALDLGRDTLAADPVAVQAQLPDETGRQDSRRKRHLATPEIATSDANTLPGPVTATTSP